MPTSRTLPGVCSCLGGQFNTYINAIKKLYLNINYIPINSPDEEHSTRNHTRIIAKQKASNRAQKCQHVNKSGRSRFGFLPYKIFTTCNVIGWLILSCHNYAETNNTESGSSQNHLTTASTSQTTLTTAVTITNILPCCSRCLLWNRLL